MGQWIYRCHISKKGKSDSEKGLKSSCNYPSQNAEEKGG